VLSWGFTPQKNGGFGFRRVHIFASAANTASCRVPRKLGLREIMHARKDRWIVRLGWTDSIAWDVLAEEWDIQRRRLKALGSGEVGDRLDLAAKGDDGHFDALAGEGIGH
jgi:hypothetical protein